MPSREPRVYFTTARVTDVHLLSARPPLTYHFLWPVCVCVCVWCVCVCVFQTTQVFSKPYTVELQGSLSTRHSLFQSSCVASEYYRLLCLTLHIHLSYTYFFCLLAAQLLGLYSEPTHYSTMYTCFKSYSSVC